MPGWCVELDERALRFILDHELEHVRSGDLGLLFLAGVLPILLPWHLPLWWQLARLRTAVEGDCDLRVLARNPGQAGSYLDLLLAVGERSSRRRPAAAMLSEPYHTLKRRIRIMTMPSPRKPWVRGGVLGGVGAVLLGVACLVPGPSDAQTGPFSQDDAVSGTPGAQQAGQTVPVFTPYTVSPEPKNREAVIQALEQAYPAELREAGVGGTVVVWCWVNERGRIDRLLVNRSSGRRALDDAALRIGSLMEFNPALNRDQPRGVWVSLPIEFTVGERPQADIPAAVSGEPGGARGERGARSGAAPAASGPTGEIAGTVTDAGSGQPLASVQLFIPGTGRGTLSDQEGRFVIQHAPAGADEVVALLIGYEQVSRQVVVKPGARAEVSFELRLDAIPLEKLVVRGGVWSGADPAR